MPVITVSRELGSHGDDVAVAVAERLGLRLIGRELINRAARQAGAPEVALAEIDELGLLGVKPSPAALQLYHEKVTAVIRDQAAAGDVVLVGRGGQMVLAGQPGVLHVRIIAPRKQRIQAVQAQCNVPADVATARVEASDRARAGYLRRSHGVSCDHAGLYDVTLNMAQLAVSTAVDLICLAVERLGANQRQADSAPSAAGGCE